MAVNADIAFAQATLAAANLADAKAALGMSPESARFQASCEDGASDSEAKSSMKQLIDRIESQIMNGSRGETAKILAQEGIRRTDPNNRSEEEKKALAKFQQVMRNAVGKSGQDATDIINSKISREEMEILNGMGLGYLLGTEEPSHQ